MALPATINPTTPPAGGPISQGDDEIRALKQLIIDLFGLPADPVNLTAAPFDISAAGVVEVLQTGLLFQHGTVGAPGIGFKDRATTGLYSSAADTLDIAAGGVRAASFLTVASGVNYPSFTPGATSNPVLIGAAGADTDIDLRLVPKGAGVLLSPKITGSTASMGTLTLSSTKDGTKGRIDLGSASALGSSSGYDEFNVRLGIGTQLPQYDIHVAKNTNSAVASQSANGIPLFTGIHARGTLSAPEASQATDALAMLLAQGYGASAYTPGVGWMTIKARENFTDSAHGTYFEVATTPTGSTAPAVRLLLDSLGLRIGDDGMFAQTAFHVGLINGVGAITVEESTATPSEPEDGVKVRMYLKDDKIIFQYNNNGTVRYKYLSLVGTGTGWTHTTSAP